MSKPVAWVAIAGTVFGRRRATTRPGELSCYGFTSVVDTASDLENTLALRRRIAAGEVLGPRILTAGGALYPPDGVPFYVRDEGPPELVTRLHQPSRPRRLAPSSASKLSEARTCSRFSPPRGPDAARW